MFSRIKGFKAQIGNNLLGLMLLVIIGVGVVIPVVQDIVDEANLTGITATITGMVPMLIAVLIIVYIFKAF